MLFESINSPRNFETHMSIYFDGLEQERRNSTALAMELCLKNYSSIV